MSFLGLLNHRCDLYDLVTVDHDGSPITSYQKINTRPIKCRLDLSFVRQGKDQQWLGTVARPSDRTGTMFLDPKAPIKSGIRCVMIKGPTGIFQIQGAIDEAWDYNSRHHYEVGVVEVSTLQMRYPVIQVPGD